MKARNEFMRTRLYRFKCGFLMIFAILVFGSDAEAQIDGAEGKGSAILIDAFGRVTDCDMGARMDNFFIQLHNNRASLGYVIFYQGADVLPAKMTDNVNRRLFLQYINFRRYDAQTVVMIDGGYRHSIWTEFWIVPPGADPPVPSKNVDPPTIPSDKTFLFDSSDFFFNNDLEFLLDEVRERIQREEEEEEEEEAEEEEQQQNESDNDSGNTSEYDDDNVDEDFSEEVLEPEYEWFSSNLKEFLIRNPRSDLHILYYADDLHYDIRKIEAHILAAVGEIGIDEPAFLGRILVRFGGYRNGTKVEYWIVPIGSDPPIATPGDRPID
ncbi:MAG: hypothetical protein KF881_00035 [Acidobacteria bacterium]|nr:hypothetical protein [Acidobacteriota bacterium]